MTRLFHLHDALRRDPAVDEWLASEPGELFAIARHWFGIMRHCGDDVRDLTELDTGLPDDH